MAYKWIMKNIFCCFYAQENEYEHLIDAEGVISFLLDKENGTMEPVDVADALDHVGVDDEKQLVLFFEGWRGCVCKRCLQERARRGDDTSSIASASSSPSGLRFTRRSRSVTYQQLGQTEEDLQMEDMNVIDGIESESDDGGDGKGKIRSVLRVKSADDQTNTRLRAVDSDSDLSTRTRTRAVRFDNEINIAWTHKKAKYERSFYPPSMREAKTRSDKIVAELQSVHRELFPEGGSECFAVAIRKSKERRQQRIQQQRSINGNT